MSDHCEVQKRDCIERIGDNTVMHLIRTELIPSGHACRGEDMSEETDGAAKLADEYSVFRGEHDCDICRANVQAALSQISG